MTDLPREEMPFDWIESSYLPFNFLAASKQPPSIAAIHYLASQGIKVIISLTERSITEILDIQNRSIPKITYCHSRIEDGQPPSLRTAQRCILDIEMFRADQPVLIHCREGMGRTGTILHFYLMSLGASLEQAQGEILESRPSSQWLALTEPQRDWLSKVDRL